ncbi:MAG: hypothetical protein WC631_03165 [Candidatus Paceibacterota bacterium]|jgi:hypothetical protein
MHFHTAIKILSQSLKEKQPKEFSPSWILASTPNVYRHIQKNVRTENNSIDWDRVTSHLHRYLQKRWIRYRRKQAKPYDNQDEVDRILNKYKDKLYTFMSPQHEKDRHIRDRIIVALVRISQKGNALAQRELISWIRYIVDDWIDKYPQIWRWRGYSDPIEEKIEGCILRYRYTGSFLGYLFKTLEYSSKGLRPLCSLDDPILGGAKTRIDYAIQERE